MDEIQKIKGQMKTYVKFSVLLVSDRRIHNVDYNPMFSVSYMLYETK